MHLLLPSDVFPPGSVGGAAWSSYTLAHALQQHGHTVTVIVPVAGGMLSDQPSPPGVLQVIHHPYPVSRIPFVQNYSRHERLWPPLAARLVRIAQASPQHDVLIHAQHVQTAPAAVLAGQQLRIPVVITVRDHWPWDYFATGLHGNRIPYPQPIMIRHASPAAYASLLTDLVARLGTVRGLLALPALPYMVGHIRRRAAYLAQADAVIAVSSYIAQRLAPLVSAERLHVIPNMVDIPAVEQLAATPLETPLTEPFLLFVGKLERNKGAGLLTAIFRILHARVCQGAGGAYHLPLLVIAGTGELRPELERELTRLGVRVRFLAWVSHDEIIRLMARCTVLLFPSVWGEPLSRVLLEASAVGAPIIAMPTGGTSDIILDGSNGLLARTPEQFAWQLNWLLQAPTERHRLSAQARQVAQQQFAVAGVLPRMAALYAQLCLKSSLARQATQRQNVVD